MSESNRSKALKPLAGALNISNKSGLHYPLTTPITQTSQIDENSLPACWINQMASLIEAVIDKRLKSMGIIPQDNVLNNSSR